jgi:hypothetical protein
MITVLCMSEDVSEFVVYNRMVAVQHLLICLVVISGAILSLSHCEIEYESCTSDYEVLEKVVNTPQNIFLLKTTFFPPHTDNPLYVTVTYNFSTISVDYIWSTAFLYLTVHPRIISYLSLFFSYIEANRVVGLELQLPEECSDLANNTKSDATNFLFLLTHRLRLYAESSTESEDLEVKAVAAQNRKQDNHSEKVALFFSLAIGLPLAAIVLIWVGVHGAFPYIRSHINDSEIFPNVAALYWIGQTFTLFVIAMDVVALSENSTIDEYDKLEYYQLLFLSLITILEIVGLFISFVLAFITLFSHFRHTNCKIFFQGYFQIMCCGVVSFKQIGRKEARIWLLLNSLVTPLIAALSHSGFIIGGWVSYEDRSFAHARQTL